MTRLAFFLPIAAAGAVIVGTGLAVAFASHGAARRAGRSPGWPRPAHRDDNPNSSPKDAARWRHDVVLGTVAAGGAATASLVRILSLGRSVDGLVGLSRGGLPVPSRLAQRAMAPHPLALVGVGVATWLYIEGRRHSTLAWRRVGAAVARERMLSSLDRVLAMEIAEFDMLVSANGVTGMINDVGDLARGVEGVGDLVQLAANSMMLTGAFILLAPRLAWIPITAIGAMGVVLLLASEGETVADPTDQYALAQRQALEAIEALTTVKAYGLAPVMVDRVAATLDAHVRDDAPRAANAVRDPLRLEAITMIGVAATTLVAAGALASGTMSPGRHLALMMISGHLFYPFAYTGQPLNAARRGLAAHRRLRQLAALASEADGDPMTQEAISPGPLRFDSVSFQYPGRAMPALDRVSFTLPTEGVIAIVGASGSGKSTLTRLILRFHEPDSGAILLDDRQIATMPRAAIRHNIAWVDQRSYLFDGSIADNIALAMATADVDRSAIEAAGALAAIDDFADQLEHGYDTAIGPRGSRLSDGQRQRVLLARALLKPAPVLILDEATSALDAETERQVLANVRRHAKGRMLIMIAHHLTNIQDADLILVMDQARLVSQGRHAELLETCPQYRTLVEG